VSVMGRAGECYGIGVYPGFKPLLGMRRLIECPMDSMLANPLSFQDCMMCYYGDREEIEHPDREVMKALDLKFRGKNNWIYFRVMEPGYLPWFLNAEQADLLTEILQNFVEAYTDYISGKLEIDFENGETLIRKYSSEKEEWTNEAAPSPPIPMEIEELQFKDELLLKRLKNSPKTKIELELDILYLPTPVQDKKDEKPYFPRFIMLADHKTGQPLFQNLMPSDIENRNAAISVLVNYINEHGKPAKLHLRDKFFAPHVDSFCEQVGIKAVYKGVDAIDDFAEQLMRLMGGGFDF